MADYAIVRPAAQIAGRVTVPGDKSISHRVAMLSALASGTSTIRGYLRSEDCMNTLKALAAVGAEVDAAGEPIRVRGTGGRFHAPSGSLDCGNSGTCMRLLAGFLSGQSFTSELIGDASLSSRPMRRIRDPLVKMGVRVELTGEAGTAPLRVTGGALRGIDYTLPVASAQVKSCVLLAGLFADGETVVREPQPTRDHTEQLFRAAGVPVRVEGLTIRLTGSGAGGPAIAARGWVVPGDISSAAFWIAAAASRPGADLTVENVGLNPRRTAILDVLRRMGAHIECIVDPASAEGEPRGTVSVRGAELRATEIGGVEIPNLIDEIPVLAAVASLARGRTVIRDASELRVKESDRIRTMAMNLRAMGAAVEERPDGMSVEGPSHPRATAALDSLGDHRIAMSMAVLALASDAPTRINGVACIQTSYPEFWRDLERVGGYADVHGSN
jgi:3-phosphoshikimate 1-carboxyvinyltransferase